MRWFGLSFAPKPKYKERFARQYRYSTRVSPDFALLMHSSPSLEPYTKKTLSLSTFRLHGHIALAIPSLLETDPQILEHWGYANEDLLSNHSKRWILVSNVSTTYDGFSESNTSDWLQYV